MNATLRQELLGELNRLREEERMLKIRIRVLEDLLDKPEFNLRSDS